ncbi:FAD-binding oxidoreductase [Phenylobacterium sp.]|uniref:NAD(P)/FAD-dependent oxidoreductase n=1 Tax=Phenylobacterium sp. TaxID=1871053 RepID=UPI0012264744|nr:FAD-binding oxidoreductase [Phenylobacterium sp.]THD71702.1 MAG: FAD-binding oxidoreductase [Phenylobacterium sp.]
MSTTIADVVVIGAGIAGASVAAALAQTQKVIVLEREAFPGMHSTGRSAALFSEIYGSVPIRALSRASRNFLYSPPEGFVDAPIVRPRGAMHIASAAQLARLEAFCALPDVAPAIRRLTAAEASAQCSVLRGDYVAAAAVETGSADVDVDVLHQGWLRQVKARGGELVVNAEVVRLSRQGSGWLVETPDIQIEAKVVINAAGAWADVIARLAGVRTVGLQPNRRTALIVAAPDGSNSDEWPMVIDVDEQFYFRPDAGALLLSPGDETPSEPCDAQPDEWDIATAVDRVQTATTLEVHRIRRSWAGLRSFVADRSPVVGFAPDAPGFFWLAGQGGYGIQTAPAMGALACALVLGEPAPDDLVRFGVSAYDLRPDRFTESLATAQRD